MVLFNTAFSSLSYLWISCKEDGSRLLQYPPPSVEAGGLTLEVKRSISPIITGVNLKVTFFLRVGMIVEAEAATFLGLPRRRVTGGGGSG